MEGAPMNPSYARHWVPPGISGMEELTITDLPVIVRYEYALANLPPSGGGGCHTALLGVANLGCAAGLSRENIALDLTKRVEGMPRKVTAREIRCAIDEAFSGRNGGRTTPRVPITPEEGERIRNTIISYGIEFDEARLLDASPVRIVCKVERDSITALQHLYSPEEFLFLGKAYDSGPQHVRLVSEWIRRFERGFIPEHIVPNPLTGKQGTTKDGKPSYRADACVACFRFAVLEFDGLPRAEQIHFWAGARLPIAALIDSGGKSIHAWVRIDAENEMEWRVNVEERLFDVLAAIGIDRSCRNESRLSRTPGHLRLSTGNHQRLLYLAPDGRAVQP
jgi:hypothetical protein